MSPYLYGFAQTFYIFIFSYLVFLYKQSFFKTLYIKIPFPFDRYLFYFFFIETSLLFSQKPLVKAWFHLQQIKIRAKV